MNRHSSGPHGIRLETGLHPRRLTMVPAGVGRGPRVKHGLGRVGQHRGEEWPSCWPVLLQDHGDLVVRHE